MVRKTRRDLKKETFWRPMVQRQARSGLSVRAWSHGGPAHPRQNVSHASAGVLPAGSCDVSAAAAGCGSGVGGPAGSGCGADGPASGVGAATAALAVGAACALSGGRFAVGCSACVADIAGLAGLAAAGAGPDSARSFEASRLPIVRPGGAQIVTAFPT